MGKRRGGKKLSHQLLVRVPTCLWNPLVKVRMRKEVRIRWDSQQDYRVTRNQKGSVFSRDMQMSVVIIIIIMTIK